MSKPVLSAMTEFVRKTSEASTNSDERLPTGQGLLFFFLAQRGTSEQTAWETVIDDRQSAKW